MRYASKFTSISGAASLPFQNYLKKNNICDDSVILSGHLSGFIGGTTLPKSLHNNTLEQDIVKVILNKHSLSINDMKKKDGKLELEICKQIESYCNQTSDTYRAYEIWEWRERQAKFITNVNRYYEFIGYKWNAPFCESRLLEFWSAVPLDKKLNGILYDGFLETEIFKKLGLQYNYDLKRRSKKNILSSIKNNLYFLKKNRMIKDILSRIRSKNKQSDQFGFEFSLPALCNYADRDFPKGFSIVERYKKQFHLESKSSYFYLAQYVLSMLVEDLSA